jgi:CSLREA domain-containing protein
MLSRSRIVFSSTALPLLALGTLWLVFILYLPSQAASTTYTVNSTADSNDGVCNAADCTLREAILAANDTPEPDAIVFSLPPSSAIVLNGNQLPSVTGTLTIDGSMVENLTISGDNASRVLVIGPTPLPYPVAGRGLAEFSVGSTAIVTLTNLHITAGNESKDFGGGIYNSGTLFISNSILSDFTSKYGGVFNSHRLVVNNSTFIGNSVLVSSFGGGAGIYNTYNGTATIANSTFLSNTVTAFSQTGGGAIYNDKGVININGSRFDGNHSDLPGGGAIYSRSPGVLTISNSTFTNNSAYFGGGGIYALGTVTITNSTFEGNFANYAGALNTSTFGWASQIDILNSNFSNNFAAYDGGAIFNNAKMNVYNSTFSGNSAQGGGAIVNGNTAGKLTIGNSTIAYNSAITVGGGIFNLGILSFTNTIIANSLDGGDCVNNGMVSININNLIEDGSCSPAISGDPLLGPLQSNGGQTPTHAPLPSSLAIDNGDNSICEEKDQRGIPRPIDGDDNGSVVCDIGSVEVGGKFMLLPVIYKGLG